ncbi:MAG: hypothetical protein H0W53_20215 [Acidobacteria bacterium]|nr:hypothetical protein [Acidobacteriota bacterium]
MSAIARLPVVALTLLAGCSSTAPVAAPSTDTPLARARARLPQLAPCSLPNVKEAVLCGELRRPEHSDNVQARSIPIFVVVIPALSHNPHPDAWVEIPGGPGNAATDYARDYVGEGYAVPYRRDRDVLLVDARGMGRSNPLYCEQLALHRVSSLFPRFPAEAVRAWLGYSKMNLFSYSYGTRAVLTFMRHYPGACEARSCGAWFQRIIAGPSITRAIRRRQWSDSSPIASPTSLAGAHSQTWRTSCASLWSGWIESQCQSR